MEVEIVALVDLRSIAVNSENSGQLGKSLACILAVLTTPSLQAVLVIKIRAKIRFGQNSASNIHIILGKRRTLVSNVRNQL